MKEPIHPVTTRVGHGVFLIHTQSLRDVIDILYAFISCPFITNPELTLFLNGQEEYSVFDSSRTLIFHRDDLSSRSQLSSMMTMYNVFGATGVSSTDAADLHRFTLSYMPSSGSHNIHVLFNDYNAASDSLGSVRPKKHSTSRSSLSLAEKKLLSYFESAIL